ncbi:MAG: shikimate kinase [Actinomycetota bacterium]|nr:shikimate kinase [Actinomycetota bacterium]
MNQLSTSTPHVVLVGLMGTGKSTVGRRLAHKLGWEFLDTDDEINRVTGKTVRQIFESVGEKAFRQLEHDALVAGLQHSSPHIIAGAGGVILRADNRQLLRTAEHVVWLNAPLHVLVERIGQRSVTGDGHRPLIDGDPAARLEKLYAERESLYRDVSSVEIDVEGLQIPEVIDQILATTGLEAKL